MNSSLPQREPASPTTGEEFNPVAVFQVVWRRRLLFFPVFFLVLLLGVVYAAISVPANSYVTVLQIGSAYGNNSVSGKLVEDTDGVVTKLQRSIIPEVSRRWREEKPRNPIPKVTVKAKNHAGIVLLMSKAPMDREAEVAAFHKSVVGEIVAEHRSIVMKQYESFLFGSRKNLVKSEAELRQLKVALAEQEQRRSLLEQQLQRLNREIDSLSVARKELAESGVEETGLTEVYLSQLDLPAMLERRDSLENDLHIKLDLEIADIKQKIANAQSSRDAAAKYIELLEDEVGKLRLTRIQSLAYAMPEHVGLSGTVMIVMSLVLGLILAWFVVMFVEYLARQRRVH